MARGDLRGAPPGLVATPHPCPGGWGAPSPPGRLWEPPARVRGPPAGGSAAARTRHWLICSLPLSCCFGGGGVGPESPWKSPEPQVGQYLTSCHGGGGFRSFRPCSDPCDCPRGPPAPRARGVWCAVCPPPAATLRGGHVPCVLSTPCRPLSGQPRGSPQPPARPLSSCSLCCASFYPRTLQAGGAGRLRRQCPGLEGGLGMDDGRGSHPFSSVASPSDQCFVIDYGSERPPLSTGAKSSAAAFTTIPCGLGNSFSPAEKNSH